MPSETPPPQTTSSRNNSPGGAIITSDKTNRPTTPLSVKSFQSLSPSSQNLSTVVKGNSPSSISNIIVHNQDDGSLSNVTTPIKLTSTSSDQINIEQNLATIHSGSNNNGGDGESSSINDTKNNNNKNSNTSSNSNTNNNNNNNNNSSNINGNSNNSQQFCLRWNNYQSNLTSVFDQLLQNESFVDVTLACDGQSIKAHKMVLSACSPYFQTLFVDNPCQHPIIIMRDVKWFELKSIVDFMYKGEINVSQDQIGPLLRVAEMLKIRGLADVNNETENSNNNNSSSTTTSTSTTQPSSASTIPVTTTSTTSSSATSISSSSKPIISARKNDELNNLSALDLPEIAVKKARVSREWELSNIEVSSALSQQQQQQQQQSHHHQHHHQQQQQQQIQQNRHRKRRWPSSDNSHRNTESPLSGNVGSGGGGNGNGGGGGSNNSNCGSVSGGGGGGIPSGGSSTPESNIHDIASPVANAVAASVAANMNIMPTTPHPPVTPSPMPPFPLGGPLEALGLPTLSGMSHADDLEIKPGIAEMIREEERAKLMENSHAWLGASTSSIADSYQYQLQSMWQKCWNTNQNLMHHLRFRERGPLKSWRPETMAEAIFSVLKEGLSLSQAARKYDIPYPTFVLYANRVHNMLGPSIDGGTDLRPKGRGRPQRILLGIWPDEHIKGVIKTVVFRDAKELKEEGQLHLQYGRHSPVFPFQENPLNYPGGPCPNGMPSQGSSESMSPEATAAAVAAVAHGIRQQMQMAAAAQHHPDSAANLYNLPAHLQAHVSGVSIPKQNSPASAGSGGGGDRSSGGGGGGGGGSNSGQMNSTSQRHSSPQMLPNPASLAGLAGIPGLHIIPGLSSSQSNQSSGSGGGGSGNSGHHMSTFSSNSSSSHHHSHHHHQSGSGGGGGGVGSHHHHHHHSSLHSNLSRNQSPTESAHDLRMNSPDESPLHSPIEMSLEPAVNLAVGVSGMTYKPSRGYSSPRPEHLFQEDIADLVGAATSAARNCPPNMSINNFKEPSPSIKLEPLAECRSE